MLRLPNQQELSKYSEYYKGLSQNSDKIPAKVASGFLMKSQLQKNVLAKIWDLADRNHDGYLSKGEFSLAMHLIKVYRESQFIPPSLSSEVLSAFGITNQMLPNPGSAPCLSALNTSCSSIPNMFSQQATSASTSQYPSPVPQQSILEAAPNIPLLDQFNCGDMSIEGKIVCREIFEKFESVKANKKLSGQEAKVFLKRYPIPSSDLKTIWNLADRDCDGALTLAEFTLVVFLIQYKQANNSLPPVIAQDIFDKAYFSMEDEKAMEEIALEREKAYSKKVFAHIQSFMLEVQAIVNPVRETFKVLENEETNMKAQRDAIVSQNQQEAQRYAEIQKALTSDNDEIAKLRAALNAISTEMRNAGAQMEEIQKHSAYGNNFAENYKKAQAYFNQRKAEYDEFLKKSEIAKEKIQSLSLEIEKKKTEFDIILSQARTIEQEYMGLQNEIRAAQEKAYNSEMQKQALALEERRQQMQMQLYQQQQIQAEYMQQQQQQRMEALILQQEQEHQMQQQQLQQQHMNVDQLYDYVPTADVPVDHEFQNNLTSSTKFKSKRCRTPSIYKPKKTLSASSSGNSTDFRDIADPFEGSNTQNTSNFENFSLSSDGQQASYNFGEIPSSSKFGNIEEVDEYNADTAAPEEGTITYEQPFLGVMLYDYTPEDVTQASLQKDRLVMIFYKTDNYYYTGNLDATIFTYFPEDYISFDCLSEVHHRIMCEYLGSFPNAYVPLEAFQGVEEDDLSFEIGDLLFLQPSDDSWFYGYNNGKLGIAPSNYVQNVSLIDLEMYAVKTTAPCTFYATNEHEIDVSEGDTVFQHYQSTKGYVLGYNENTQKVGWFTFNN